MRSKFLAIGICLVLVGLLVGVGGCPPSGASIDIEKKVSADGGVTWLDEVEQGVCHNVQFKVTVTNEGNTPLSNIAVSDLISDGLNYVVTDGILVPPYLGSQAQPPFAPSGPANNPVWEFAGPLEPGDQITILFTVHVVSVGQHENCAKVQSGTYDDVDCVVVEGN